MSSSDQRKSGFNKSAAELDQQFGWHPFTQMRDWCDPAYSPLMLESGRGAILCDVQGREYIDGNSSIWTNLHGHAHPKINAAITAQLERVAHVSYLGSGHPGASELAGRLVDFFEPETLERVFFSDDGSTAVEVALKMAAQYWQQNAAPDRNYFVAFDNAYHGDTFGASSLGGIPTFHERFKKFHFPVLRVRSLEECAALPELAAGRVAGVIIEPMVQAVAGIRLWPEGMLSKLRDLCSQHDTFLILDEIMTGFGRTGKMFACQHEDVTPDFLCLAKGLTGGYLPLAATLTTRRVFEGFLGSYEELRSFFYGHSYTANALGCAAALASLDIFEKEKTLENLQPKIAHLKQGLAGLAEHPHVGEIRQIGFIAGIDVVKKKADETGTQQFYPWQQQVGAKVCEAAKKYGLLTRPIRDTIVLIPPYCSSLEQIDQCLDALKKALDEVCD
ncbi:MAG: adenosylmethionine--8-amino-7-oxononanoate transaminase [Chthoniobacterales bacterium]